MRRVRGLVGIGFGVLLAVGNFSMASAQQQQQQPITFNVVSENTSGVTGSAMLTDMGSGMLRVEIHTTGAGADPRPAHIHEGTCEQDVTDMGGGMGMAPDVPQYALTTLVNGVSTTDLNVSLNDLFATPHDIEVHKSADEIGFHIACADLKAPTVTPAAAAASATTTMPLPQAQMITRTLVSENDSGVTGTAMLTDLGGDKVRVEIQATGTGADPRPAHIHAAPCMTGAADMTMGMGTGNDVTTPEFALTTLVNGASTTELPLKMSDILASPHAILVHKSADEIGFQIACADLVALPTNYTVATGDTLSDIAMRYFGDGDMWPSIFNANRSLIANPNRIFAGQVLNIKP